MKIKNIYKNIPKNLPEELIENLFNSDNCKIERIISRGHSTPNGNWYDQDKNEFVLLLKGSAELSFKNNEIIKMKEGDFIIIPAHKRHRVEKTDYKKETIWLAVFF